MAMRKSVGKLGLPKKARILDKEIKNTLTSTRREKCFVMHTNRLSSRNAFIATTRCTPDPVMVACFGVYERRRSVLGPDAYMHQGWLSQIKYFMKPRSSPDAKHILMFLYDLHASTRYLFSMR